MKSDAERVEIFRKGCLARDEVIAELTRERDAAVAHHNHHHEQQEFVKKELGVAVARAEKAEARGAVLAEALKDWRVRAHKGSGLGEKHSHDPETCPVYENDPRACYSCQTNRWCSRICPEIDRLLADPTDAQRAVAAKVRTLDRIMDSAMYRKGMSVWLKEELAK